MHKYVNCLSMIMGFWYGLGKVEKESNNNVCFTGGGVFIQWGVGSFPSDFSFRFSKWKKMKKREKKAKKVHSFHILTHFLVGGGRRKVGFGWAYSIFPLHRSWICPPPSSLPLSFILPLNFIINFKFSFKKLKINFNSL